MDFQSSEENEQPSDLHYYQEIIVDKGQESIRIDKFLLNRLERVSRNRIQNAIKKGDVLVNDLPIKSNYKVRPLDTIKILLLRDPEADSKILPENIPLNIVYEDESLMVIDKPAGLVVHPGIANPSGTLVNGLVYYLQNKNLPVMEGNPTNRPGIVHRIDKDTTGLMVIAKTDYAITHLAKQFFDHTVERKYWALVWGNFDHNEGTIQGHIGRDLRDRFKMSVFEEGDYGKHAITHFKVLKDFYYVTLLECQLETGRTHQIRVHMKYINHPLFGDDKYGGDRIVKGTVYTKYKQFVDNCFKLCSRHCLHAKVLGFEHPETGKRMRFESDLPEDISAVIEKWKSYFQNKKELN